VTGFEVHPPSLQAAGQRLRELADQLDTAWQAMEATVSGMGELFGDDEVSSLIGESYQAAHEMAAESYGSVAEEFADDGDGLDQMAQQYTDADTGSDDVIADVAGAL
jgi:uncharacterized protein YukE